MQKAAKFEMFVPIAPVPKSYRNFGRKTVLGDRCRQYQKEVCDFLEKHKDSTMDHAMWAEFTFYLKRPQSSSKMTYPERKPDHDNLVKSIQDCLEKAGIIKNDSRIVACMVRKVFDSGKDSSGVVQPGTLIRLGELL